MISFSCNFHLIKGMCQKICGNWVSSVIFLISTTLLEDWNQEFICCTSVFISIIKIFKSLQNFWHRVTDITSFGNLKVMLWTSVQIQCNIVSGLWITISQGITHPVFYGYLVYTLRKVKGEANFFSSVSKIVKRLRRRQYITALNDLL